MAFPKKVREEALVLAARHCCICHRYKGVRVEVHHIVPSSEGGDDSIENAIALCFDCHADAGHYNPSHPRGTKFSRSELRAARDRWHERVDAGVAEPSVVKSSSIQSRYLICRNIEIIREIADADLSKFPFAPLYLFENEVLQLLREIVEGQKPAIRRRHVWGDSYESEEEYLAARPEAEVAARTEPGRFPYFKATREVLRTEIRERVGPRDAITLNLLDTGLDPGRISRVLTYYEACGDNRIQEIYLLRPLWLAMLAVTNVGEAPMQLSRLRARYLHGDRRQVRPLFAVARAEASDRNLPMAPLNVGETVAIPIALILPGFAPKAVNSYLSEAVEFDRAATQLVHKASVPPGEQDACQVWGSAFDPVGLEAMSDGERQWAEVHQLDLTNVYTVNRSWAIGSCPHAFFVFKGGRQYAGELFAKNPGVLQYEAVELPVSCLGLEIAELEWETTLLSIAPFTSVKALGPGHHVFVERPNDGVVRMIGTYRPLDPRAAEPDPAARNELVRSWLEAPSRRGRADLRW